MKQHILVVDDEVPILDLLSRFFEQRGYAVSTAETVQEAEQLAARTPLSLVLLDIAVAEADGLDLLVRLKALYPNLPVLMLTGMSFDQGLFKEAMQKGASGFISKTIEMEHLLQEVRQVLDGPAAAAS